MDSTVIQEIANQLGMAADQAGQFITDQLPAFAGLKAMQAAVPLIIVWVLFALCVIVSLSALFICYKAMKKEKLRYKKDKEEEKSVYKCDYKTDLEDYTSGYVFIFAGIAALVVLVFAIIMTGFLAPKIYGWSNYPEAMLIDMALKAVG